MAYEKRKVHDPAKGEIPMTGLLHKVGLITRREFSKYLVDEEWFTKENFRSPCIGVIHAIARTPTVSQKDISDWMGIDPSDLVGIVDQLENAGYVTRTRDPNDRRRQLLSLTPKGLEARKKLTKIGAKASDDVLAPLTPKERDTLHALLTRIVLHDVEKEDQ